MNRPFIRRIALSWLLGALSFWGCSVTTGEARAQSQTAKQGDQSADKGKKAGKAKAPAARKDDGRGAGAARGGGEAGKAAAARAARGAGEPSVAYQESIRQTVERRRERRARRQQNAGVTEGAVGAIVPWPMPPALIVRHTREVHGEVESLLYGLRR
jgi:hypothetical protein